MVSITAPMYPMQPMCACTFHGTILRTEPMQLLTMPQHYMRPEPVGLPLQLVFDETHAQEDGPEPQRLHHEG
eukprot:CAMPEP_0176293162 /NCGR_PEP_ID=MMETSP0121_2-20121125/56462_1 /TAXON_ID=160619 /ORGANISM="Kryptoperidinium foliaceum, Strain CCMP 1326" /LENGTH=71 /DNA_ID=CAMNT_0017634107 /DNA_START=1 /DNA_END=212 /DNA_ORIENTATION=+